MFESFSDHSDSLLTEKVIHSKNSSSVVVFSIVGEGHF